MTTPAEALRRLTASLAAAHPNHKTMFVYTADLREVLAALTSPAPAPDVAGVVERLRKVSKECNPDRIQRYYISEGADVTFHDIFVAANTAATLLTTLSAERDNLREKLSRTTEGGAYKIMQLTETVEILSAEKGRLREALEFIADFAAVTTPSSWAVDVQAISRRARTALTPKEKA